MNYQSKVDTLELCVCTIRSYDVGMLYVYYILVTLCNFVFLQGAELWTPLLVASYCNEIDILKLLIQYGAQLDTKNKVH